MKTTRLEAFSDGVLAIIITIMVLELKVPHGVELAALKPVLPVLMSYVLSFIYAGEQPVCVGGATVAGSRPPDRARAGAEEGDVECRSRGRKWAAADMPKRTPLPNPLPFARL